MSKQTHLILLGASNTAFSIPYFLLISFFSSLVLSEKYSSKRLSRDSPSTFVLTSRPS